MACLGQYLERMGIYSVFVENEIFGSGIVKSVMNRGNYIRGKRCISLLTEALQHLLFTEFMKTKEATSFINFRKQIDKFQEILKDGNGDENQILIEWENCSKEIESFSNQLDKFISYGSESSQQFKFWSNFILNLVPVLRYLACSFRQANCNLHLSAVRRAIPLFFHSIELIIDVGYLSIIRIA